MRLAMSAIAVSVADRNGMVDSCGILKIVLPANCLALKAGPGAVNAGTAVYFAICALAYGTPLRAAAGLATAEGLATAATLDGAATTDAAADGLATAGAADGEAGAALGAGAAGLAVAGPGAVVGAAGA